MSIATQLAMAVMRPFGRTIKWIDPRAYELVHWSMATAPITRRLFAHPMYHSLVLPFAVRPGDTVLDIGANTGQYTIPLAKLVGPRGRVHSFEPVSTTFSQLQMEVKAARLESRVVLNNVALGSSKGSATITVPLDRPTEATLVPHEGQQWRDYRAAPDKYVTEQVPMVTLDEYAREHSLGAISFLKCDVEGAELKVLSGARDVLSGPRPPMILLEVYEGWTRNFGYSPRDLFDFLRRAGGYEVYWICEQGLQHISPDTTPIPGKFWQWVDFLCVVPAAHRERIDVRRFLVRG